MNTPLSFSRSPKTRYLLPITTLLIVGGAALHFHRLHQADSSPPPEQAPWALQTGTVERGSVAANIQSVAVIEAAQDIVLAPQIQGSVIAVGPRAGSAVKRGQLLVHIDARSTSRNIGALEQQREAALADADYAAKQQARMDAVLAEGGVSQSQADQARTSAEAARAKVQSLDEQIAALRVNLGYARIRAPRDAWVAERLTEVGDTAVPGKPVYRLTAGRGAVVRVSLPADRIARVRVGDTLELRENGADLKLRVTRVAPAVSAAGLGTLEADAASAPFGLPIGSTVAATVRTTDSGSGLTVPMAALVGSDGGDAHVMAVVPGVKPGEPGRLRRISVRVLQEGSDRAAIEGDIQAGEQVAIGQTAVLSQLHDGDAVVTVTGAGP